MTDTITINDPELAKMFESGGTPHDMFASRTRL